MSSKTRTRAAQKRNIVLANLLRGSESAVGYAFDCMEVAEEEIRRAGTVPRNAFAACCPTPILRGLGLDLYRAHAKEIIQRVKNRRDLAPATDAELCAVMSRTSLDAPLNRKGAAVYTFLFNKLFPEHGIKVSVEEYPGQVEEEIADMRKRFRQERGA